ncbi:MAG TPA: alpha/beta fold hydrolase [Actinomycetota bacterium]
MADGLLLLHAFPLDAGMWRPQLETLGAEIPIAAPHLPGFGGTPMAGDVTTMAAAATRALEALDAAGVDRAVICGLSIGGYVAFELWRRARERIAGLVLANTRPQADTPEGVEGRRALADRLRAEGTGFLVAQPPPLLSDGAPEELWAFVRATIAVQPAEAIAAASLGMAARPDSTPDLPGIDVPTLVITSTSDRLIPPEVTAPLAEAIAGARLETIPGAGHVSNLEAPEAFTKVLREHLARCGLG